MGARFANLRLWFRGSDGAMHPTGKGVTLRKHEIAAAITALETALDELEGRSTEPPDATAEW
jgi:hypothetical protein